MTILFLSFTTGTRKNPDFELLNQQFKNFAHFGRTQSDFELLIEKFQNLTPKKKKKMHYHFHQIKEAL